MHETMIYAAHKKIMLVHASAMAEYALISKDGHSQGLDNMQTF